MIWSGLQSSLYTPLGPLVHTAFHRASLVANALTLGPTFELVKTSCDNGGTPIQLGLTKPFMRYGLETKNLPRAPCCAFASVVCQWVGINVKAAHPTDVTQFTGH